MRTLIIAAAALALGAAPAFAQGNTPYNTPAGPDTGYQSNGSSYSGQQGWHHEMYGQQGRQHHNHYARLEHHIRRELSQAGFTNIRIMPRSFIVRAQDPEGNPFMMIMNPHSVTAIRAVPTEGGNQQQYGQNGSEHEGSSSWNQAQNGGNWGMTGSSAMNNSGQSGNAINSPNGNGTYTR